MGENLNQFKDELPRNGGMNDRFVVSSSRCHKLEDRTEPFPQLPSPRFRAVVGKTQNASRRELSSTDLPDLSRW